MIEAGPHVSTFRLASLRPELWLTFYAPVRPTATGAGTSSILNRKRSGFEAKMLRVTLKGIESLVLEVELVTRLPTSRKNLMENFSFSLARSSRNK